jgi:chitinase
VPSRGALSLKGKVGAGFYLSMAPEWAYVQGAGSSCGGIWGAYLPIISSTQAMGAEKS